MMFASLLEQYISLGICLVGGTLGVLSFLAWRRERDRKMLTVTVGYAMFSLYGLIVFLEYPLMPYLGVRAVELLEHGSAVLILGGLIAFFIAITRD